MRQLLASADRGVRARTCIVVGLVAVSVVVLGGCTSTPRPAVGTIPPPKSSPETSNSAGGSALLCERRDLDARYVGGGDGGQTFMGGIVIWNIATHPCVMSGAIRFAAYSATGVRDIQAVTNGALPPVSATFPAAMAPYRDTAPDLGNYLDAQLAAPQFNAAATCSAHSAPSTFALTVGTLTFEVVNRDPYAQQNKILRGCDGRILLEGIYPPTDT